MATRGGICLPGRDFTVVTTQITAQEKMKLGQGQLSDGQDHTLARAA